VTKREQRLAENEAAFRDVNESLRYVAGNAVDTVQTIRLVCECGDDTCAAFVEATVAEYEAVRAVATHFIVLPGHVVGDIERVVSSHERFAVVEKRPGEPADIARETDPRDDAPA
jgi:hypothetical protein